MKPFRILSLALAGAGAALFLTAPRRPSYTASAPFRGRYFAHRGLHSEDLGIPENSLPAFAAAGRAGYGAELDVRLTLDGLPAVFHDDSLDRMCSVSGRVEDMTYAELSGLRLCGTGYGIPLLSETLDALGDAPVIIEIKSCRRYRTLCSAVLEIMCSYPGSACVESFDPRAVAWFRRNAPEVLRGQLSAPAGKLKTAGPAGGFMLSHLLTNFYTRPDFIAWPGCRKPAAVRLCEKLGAMRVSWTSRSPGDTPPCDAVIFEHYRPPVRFGGN